MAYVQMDVCNITSKRKNENAFEYTETLTSSNNGVSILIPTGVQNVSITLIPTAGSGKVQATTSTVSDVKANNAIWSDWDSGIVINNTTDVLYPVTAIRQVNISGTTKINVRAQ